MILNHSCEVFHAFLKSINPIVTLLERMEFQLVYLDVDF